MIVKINAAPSKAAYKEIECKEINSFKNSLQVLLKKTKIKFSQDVLEKRLKLANEWFSCCKKNLEKSEIGSKNFHRWKINILESMKRIFEIEELLYQNVISEKKVISQIYDEKRKFYA